MGNHTYCFFCFKKLIIKFNQALPSRHCFCVFFLRIKDCLVPSCFARCLLMFHAVIFWGFFLFLTNTALDSANSAFHAYLHVEVNQSLWWGESAFTGQFADFELEFLPINSYLSTLARLPFLHILLSLVGSLMCFNFHPSIHNSFSII